MSRFQDDILTVFPLQKTKRLGPLALKQSYGGPYPDSIGIKSEQIGKKVTFLDTIISWRRPRWDHQNSRYQPFTLTWSLYEKRKDPKFSKLRLRRGIDSSSALSTKIQLSSILSEGIRMSRKCLRLHNFLTSFGDFMIDFITQHNNDTTINRRQLLSRFHHVMSRAAGDHFHEWKLNQSQLWDRLTGRIRRCIPQRPLSSLEIRLIRSIINSPSNTSKRQRPSPYLPVIIPDVPSQVTNAKPLKYQRLNSIAPDPSLIIPNPNANNAEPLICRPSLSYPLDINPTTPTYQPVDDTLLPKQKIFLSAIDIPNSPTDCSNNDAVCEFEDLDSKLDVLPSPTPTPQ